MTVRVVRLGEPDWRAHRELRLESLRSAPSAFATTYQEGLAMSEAQWRELLTGAVTFWQAREDGEVLGMAGLWEDPDRPASANADLIAMFVRPAARGRGVARALVQAVQDEARARGHRQLALHVEAGNETALRLYLRAGFRPDGAQGAHPHRPDLLQQPMVCPLERDRAAPRDGTFVRTRPGSPRGNVGPMPVQAKVVWDPGFTKYDFGPHHPMSPVRLDLTAKLCDAFGLFDHPDVELVNPQVPEDAVLERVHERVYIEAVKEASADPTLADLRFGIGTDDDPAFAGMHEASARVVEGTRQMCEAVWTGQSEHGVNFCGGLHHAMPANASGFCIYNDIAVGITWLLDHGVERVAYVDVDVHHGDGVEAIFWDDPRVLTVSIHETGRSLFPGTGWATDIGGANAHGHAVNVSLPPGVGDADWLRAFHSVALPVVRAFHPQVLVTQHGTDTHAQDPLAHLALSVDAQRDAAVVLHRLSHELCDGRWVAVGGGGYEIVNVVPRTWTHLTAIASHRPILPRTPVPPAWTEYVLALKGRPGPGRMGDRPDGEPIWWRSWDLGYDPGNPVDRAIMATRQAVFPLHGLDVWFG